MPVKIVGQRELRIRARKLAAVANKVFAGRYKVLLLGIFFRNRKLRVYYL